jgi:hypothetical protein
MRYVVKIRTASGMAAIVSKQRILNTPSILSIGKAITQRGQRRSMCRNFSAPARSTSEIFKQTNEMTFKNGERREKCSTEDSSK